MNLRRLLDVSGRAESLPPHRSAPLMDQLEQRMLLTAFTYQEFPAFLDLNAPIEILRPGSERAPSHTIGTSVAGIGDVDGDGKADIVVGAAGLGGAWFGGSRSLAAVYSGGTGELLYTVSDGAREFGASVAGLGDVDGDGVPDFAVGSPRFNAEGRNDPKHHFGAAYIYSGKDGTLIRSFIHEQSTDRSTGFAARGDHFGDSVGLSGDVNNDGTPDLIVGAPGVDGAGVDRGRAFIYSGLDGALLATFDGAADGYRLGTSVDTAGDVDGDGMDDVVVGAPGSPVGPIMTPGHVYIFSGADSSTLFTFTGSAPRDLFGFAVASAGDTNGDGTPDIIVGAPGRRSGDSWGDDSSDGSIDWDEDDCDHFFHQHAPFAGRAVIFSGADGSQLLEIKGKGAHDNLGAAVAGAGDVDGDGFDDVIVGAPSANPDGNATIYSGKDGSVIVSFSGRTSPLVDSDRLGTSVAMVGDVNGDGFDDFAFGATQDANPFRNDRGRVYVFSGAIAANLLPEGMNDGDDIWGTQGTGDHTTSFLILNGTLFTLDTKPGFEEGDKVIDVNMSDTVLGEDKDGAPFLWKDGTRTLLADKITTFDGPAGNFTSMHAVDLTDSDKVLVERLADGTTSSAWVLTDETLKFVFDGVPVAMNEAGAIVGTNPAADPAASVFWTESAGVTDIANFAAVGINKDGVVVGTRQPEVITSAVADQSLAATWKDGTFTPLGVIEGGTGFVPSAINDKGQVVGHYTTADGKVSGFFVAPDQPIKDIKPLVKSGGTDQFFNSTDIALLDINNKSLVIGALNDAGVGFLLKGFEGPGPFDGKGDLQVASARDADGDLHVFSINEAGEIIVMTKSAATGQWTAQDLAELLGAPGAIDVVAWRDPRSGNAVFAASSREGLLLFTQGPGDTWTMRNLTHEIAGSTPIVTGLVQFTTTDGIVYLAGLDTNSDLVVYRQTRRLDTQGQRTWEYINISRDQLRTLGLATPVFNGKLIAFVTDWNALNIAGLDRDGNLQVCWIAPSMSRWVVSNLTHLTGGTPLSGGLSVFLTGWGGINLVGVDRENHAVATWWVPAFGATWHNDDLTALTGGTQLRTESLTAYVTPWGALNIVGLDNNGKVIALWWTPGMPKWIASSIETTSLDNETGDLRGAPRGRLSSLADGTGSTDIYWTSAFGEIKRLHWQPGQAWWQVESVSVAN